MKARRSLGYLIGVLLAAGACFWSGCGNGAPVRTGRGPRLTTPGRTPPTSSRPLPTYEGLARGEWSIEDLDIPTEKILSEARRRSDDAQFVWGAAETALSSRNLKTSQRDEALRLLEGLADRYPQDEAYAIRAVSHALRWPNAYTERTRKFIRTHGLEANALADCALAACDLTQSKDGEAQAKLVAASVKGRYEAYELEALRASVHAMEASGYSAFSARMLAFFRRTAAHSVWMNAISRYYDDKARRAAEGKQPEGMGKLFEALAAMAMKAKDNAKTLDTELAAIQVAKRSLMRRAELLMKLGDAVGVVLIQKEIDEIDTRRELLNEYLARRNAAFQPGTAQWKEEREWVGFFDAVLAKGEAEAIRNDRMIEGPAPLGRMRVPTHPEK